jgi:nicotinamide-nucleotide amidase
VRKQATLPEGALSLGLAGTAPGSVLDTGSCVFVVLPGPPRELQRLWPRALEAEPVRRVFERAAPPERRVLRFYGASESEVARALADAGGDGDGVAATICAREFEIHVDVLAVPEAAARAGQLTDALRDRLQGYVFAEDERPVAELVLELCRERGYTLATAESCTGGLVAARLTEVPGASDVFRGSVVAYANEVKGELLGVSAEVLDRHGAVSPETAAAMAAGVRERLGVDVGISVTGVAGPGGGTPEKPVGLVCFHVSAPGDAAGGEFSVPSDRKTVRARATVAALHLARGVLARSRHGSA